MVWIYLSSALLSSAAVTVALRLWNARLSVPFQYQGDAVSSAMYFKTVLQTGWYETQPDLGVPYGQHLHDFPFSDELQPAMIKVLGVFSHQWPIVYNSYYLLGYPLAALTAVWFLRRCGLSGWTTVALSVLFSVAPYHFWRAEGHLFLGEYWAVPLGLGVVLAVIRGEPIWGRRHLSGRWARLPALLRAPTSVLTGRGAGTFLAIALLTLDGAYYGVFVAVLLAPAAVLAWLRTHDWRRLVGVMISGVALMSVFVAAMLPDILYERIHGSDPGALVRHHLEAELYALKFTSLILPAPGHSVPALARLRAAYDAHYAVPGEGAALGLIGSIGFLLLLGHVFVVLVRRRSQARTDSVRDRRWQTFDYLSALTWFAFLASSLGGIGTLLSYLTSAIRGWNRMSVLITLLVLAGFGIALESGLRVWRERMLARRPDRTRLAGLIGPLAAVLVLLVGCADQFPGPTVRPDYTDPAYAQDAVFVAALETQVPAGSMIFQTPYLAFPEGGFLHRGADPDQLKLWLHSTDLKFSGGGIKGRPQTDWPKTVSEEPPAVMTTNLAIVGFAGIVVDRFLTTDGGTALGSALAPYTGAPTLVSPGGRWAYYSLRRSLTEIARRMTPRARSAEAAVIVHTNG